jgi:molybdopterin/thiamine biosynthesis adenylyltransferase
MAPSCQEAGVLGVLPGIIGTMQANEAIKLILGVGQSLSGRLLVFDAPGTKWRTLKLRKDPECRVCSKKPEDIELIDYEAFCSIGG